MCKSCAHTHTYGTAAGCAHLISDITFLSRSLRSLLISSIAKHSILLPIYTVLFYVDRVNSFEFENVGKSDLHS
jgi:hypothetical protein